MGRNKSYKTPKAFEKAVDAYFKSLMNEDGSYKKPPTLSGLCLHLDISRDTFASYAKIDGYSDTARRARARVEAFLEECLVVREKGVQGIIFNLSANFGWREKHEISASDDENTQLFAMSMEEKLAVIREARQVLSNLDNNSKKSDTKSV